MNPKLIKTTVASYIPAMWSGVNTSGHIPLNDNVMIMPDLAATKVGGLFIPADVSERQDMAAETGIIVAIGPGAFVFDSGFDWIGYKPIPGDRVYMERYAGQLVKGRDGKMYRLMASRCVGSVEHVEPVAVNESAVQEVA